jgi:hypothetical protein
MPKDTIFPLDTAAAQRLQLIAEAPRLHPVRIGREVFAGIRWILSGIWSRPARESNQIEALLLGTNARGNEELAMAVATAIKGAKAGQALLPSQPPPSLGELLSRFTRQ